MERKNIMKFIKLYYGGKEMPWEDNINLVSPVWNSGESFQNPACNCT